MAIEGPELGDDDIGRLHHAYLLWNTFEEAEFAVKAPTRLEGGGVTQHFSRVLSMPAKNEVFSLDSDSWSRL